MGIDVITVEWKGNQGTINAKEAFLAAEQIEEHVTVFELFQMTQDVKKLKIAKLAKAYAALCKVAGVPADAGAIRSEIAKALRGDGRGDDSFWTQIMGVVQPLLAILTDGQPDADSEGDTEGNVNPPAS